MVRVRRVTLFFLALCILTCTRVTVSLFHFVKGFFAVLLAPNTLAKVFSIFFILCGITYVLGLGSVQSTFGTLDTSRRRCRVGQRL